MKDPATSHLRIYVGNLTDQVTVDDLYEHFSNYGQINGIIINKNFGFIQFEDESSVQTAILQGHSSELQGRSIAVKAAQSNSDKTKQQPQTDLASTPDKQTEENKYGSQTFQETQFQEESFDQRSEGYTESYRGRGASRGRGRGGRMSGRGIDSSYPDWNDRSYDHYRTQIDYPRVPVGVNDRNDCEIIVVAKALTDYAEHIEDKLKRLGIVVDLMFPNEDVPIGMMLGNIASRGTLYAILVMPDNLKYRSLTLTILHGLPQEHRNIPLDDALKMISRNYEEVRRGGSSGREAVYALLGQLADGKTLTVLQYDKVIQYLKERREQQVKLEVGEPITKPEEGNESDLQKRILNILNEKKIGEKEADPVQNAAKLANDPKIRDALDSILQKYV